MDAVIVGLVGLGGLYAISNQKEGEGVIVNEGFTNNSLPNKSQIISRSRYGVSTDVNIIFMFITLMCLCLLLSCCR